MLAFSLLAAACGIPGCAKEAAPTDDGVPRLKSVVSLYNAARTMTGRPPAKEEDFKAFIVSKGGSAIEELGLASADELFVSERDGQPFVIVYGARPKGMHNDVVAYEQQGVDGKRQVGFGLGMVETVDDARFRELVPESAAPK